MRSLSRIAPALFIALIATSQLAGPAAAQLESNYCRTTPIATFDPPMVATEPGGQMRTGIALGMYLSYCLTEDAGGAAGIWYDTSPGIMYVIVSWQGGGTGAVDGSTVQLTPAGP